MRELRRYRHADFPARNVFKFRIVDGNEAQIARYFAIKADKGRDVILFG
jgi:hypothetical protein